MLIESSTSPREDPVSETAAVELPIFVSADGARARRIRLAGFGLGALAFVWLAALAAGLLGVGRLPGLPLPPLGGLAPPDHLAVERSPAAGKAVGPAALSEEAVERHAGRDARHAGGALRSARLDPTSRARARRRESLVAVPSPHRPTRGTGVTAGRGDGPATGTGSAPVGGSEPPDTPAAAQPGPPTGPAGGESPAQGWGPGGSSDQGATPAPGGPPAERPGAGPKPSSPPVPDQSSSPGNSGAHRVAEPPTAAAPLP